LLVYNEPDTPRSDFERCLNTKEFAPSLLGLRLALGLVLVGIVQQRSKQDFGIR
jgi:hypothetical protein